MDAVILLEKCLWFGLAATGFAILFNVPSRTLLPVFILGAVGGITKVILIDYFHINIIIATFCGSSIIGILSIPFAHKRHAPPPTFAIPAIIPMVPGVLAYKMMQGLIYIASGDANPALISETVTHGLKVMFILMSLAAGVELPMLITRKQSAKELRFKKTYKKEEH
ncbi:threonine/serine exporter family protein [Filimonas effusa]|uniref:Threonine/serine exporter n=1 Tax=Filimonas effusa TaxID=2508721 RepID=A0A4Q1DA59_9BACT|nr:threonine/serine exporter family protein [Filimonas effusa]RXK85788.1 threonine/serine exporter [Filimonas effusa]